MEFPSNSHNQAEGDKPKKNVEKVVTGEVVKRPKSIGRRFKSIFFGGEFRSVARYIAADVLLPAARNLIVDTTTEGIRRAVYGDSTVRRRGTPEYRPRVSYHNPINPINRIARDPRERAYLPDQPPHITRTSRHQGIEFVITSREDADSVVESLIDIIDKYEIASVADLYELLGQPSSHVDNKWGWTSLNRVDIRQTRDGYIIDLPQPEVIE